MINKKKKTNNSVKYLIVILGLLLALFFWIIFRIGLLNTRYHTLVRIELYFLVLYFIVVSAWFAEKLIIMNSNIFNKRVGYFLVSALMIIQFLFLVSLYLLFDFFKDNKPYIVIEITLLIGTVIIIALKPLINSKKVKKYLYR
jgi:hypothetical protein